MKIKLFDLYNLKISNNLYYISKLIYFIILILITTLLPDDEFIILYKLIYLIYILIFIINLIATKIRTFDIFFISNRNKVFNIYLKIIVKELFYIIIMSSPLLIKFDYYDLFTIYLYNTYYFLLLMFIYISSAQIGSFLTIFSILGLIISIFINYKELDYILLNINLIDSIYISSNIYYNFVFLFIVLILCRYCYKNTTFRNIF